MFTYGLDSPWNLNSRVHTLNHFPEKGMRCFVKRDDELGCGISGTKLRKYASIVPFIKSGGIRHLIIIAGSQSNNLLAAVQVARELGLQFTAFLIKPWNIEYEGNFKLTSLFLNPESIVWVARDQWPEVEALAENYCASLNDKAWVLKEGASVLEALEGSKTLAYDILQNEKDYSLHFDHILMDAGTGFAAAGLIQGLEETAHPAQVHVLLLADNESLFRERLKLWTGLHGDGVHCFLPKTAKSFGAVNQSIRDEIQRVAREEGILVDPIYSAKLFHESRSYLLEAGLSGTVLIIHSGGALTLSACPLKFSN